MALDRRIALMALASIGWPLRSGYGQSAPAGRVNAVVGEATAEKDVRKRSLSESSPVYIGDTIATGVESRLGVALGEATTLRLGERARLTIDRFLVETGGVIELKSGPLFFNKSKAVGPIQIRSAFGLIGVRGTQLFAGPSRDVFGVFVVTGSVVVTNAGRSVTVAAGFGTDIKTASSQPTQPARWGQARIDAAMASVS